MFAVSPIIRAVLVEDSLHQASDTLSINSSQSIGILFFETKHSPNIYTCDLINQADTLQKQTTRNSLPIVVYNNLSIGTYHFFVKSISSATPDTLLIIVVPQTIDAETGQAILKNWWFIGLFLLYLVLLLGALYYFISLSKVRYKEKLFDLRSDWTNKLHTDIGGDLGSISLRIDNLRRKLKADQPKLEKKITRVSDTLTGVQKKLRLFFDLVDPKKDSLHIILIDLHYFAKENFSTNQMALDYKNDLDLERDYTIDIGRINKLYLIVKELINNCLKHAKASLVSIHIYEDTANLILIVKDNGQGFDTTKNHKGNGLKNIQQYCLEGYIDVKMESEQGLGTSAIVITPMD